MKPGDMFAKHYDIIAQIGKGGMGTVFLAKDVNLANGLWAIKEINKVGKTQQQIKTALDEANLLSKLNNGHIPRVTSIHSSPSSDYIYIVQDFIDGKTLNDAISTRAEEIRARDNISDPYILRQLSLSRIKNIARQIIDIFIYLQTRTPPVLYRDLKPSNLMIDRENNIKLIDFGIAFEMTPENLQPGAIQPMGTLGYAAPEQFGANLYHTLQTDIFTFGRTLYELTTGFNPSQQRIDPKTKRKVPVELPPIRQLRKDVDEALEEIIYKCMDPDLSKRYKTFQEIKYAFEHYSELGPSYRQKAVKRLNTIIALSITSVTLLGSSGGLFLYQHHQNKIEYSNMLARVDVYNNISDVIKVINTNPSEVKPFNRLVELYERDGKFTIAEEDQFVGLITKSISSLQKSKGFGDLAYNIGLMYVLYYQPTTDQQTNKNIKLAQSTQWFKNAVDYDTTHENTAKIYLAIGQFARDITTKVRQGEDKGLYKPYFENLDKITNQVNSKTPDALRLELVDIIFSAIDQYGKNIEADGVEPGQIKDLLKRSNKILSDTNTSSDQNTETKVRLLQTYTKLESRY